MGSAESWLRSQECECLFAEVSPADAVRAAAGIQASAGRAAGRRQGRKEDGGEAAGRGKTAEEIAASAAVRRARAKAMHIMTTGISGISHCPDMPPKSVAK